MLQVGGVMISDYAGWRQSASVCKEFVSMWWMVLVLGLGAIGVACGVWYLQRRRAVRFEHERLWRLHHDWQSQSRHDTR